MKQTRQIFSEGESPRGDSPPLMKIQHLGKPWGIVVLKFKVKNLKSKIIEYQILYCICRSFRGKTSLGPFCSTLFISWVALVINLASALHSSLKTVTAILKQLSSEMRVTRFVLLNQTNGVKSLFLVYFLSCWIRHVQ